MTVSLEHLSDDITPGAAQPQRGPSPSKKKALRSFLTALIALLIGYSALAGWHALSAFRATHALTLLAPRLAEGRITTSDYGILRQQMDTLKDDLGTLDWQITPLRPLAAALAWFPAWGPDIAAIPHLVAMGAAGARTADHLLQAGQPVIEQMEQGGGMTKLVVVLSAQKEPIQQAQLGITKLKVSRDHIKDTQNLHPQVAALLNLFDRHIRTAEGVTRLVAALPSVAGVDAPRSYLLLGQNSDELRATGGFITIAGILTVERGDVLSLDFRDSYGFDSDRSGVVLPAPEPMQRFMGLEAWRFRDANWWADFPASAQQAEAFLWQEQGIKVDGVIGFDQSLMERLLAILGPVTLAKYQVQVDASNVVKVMEAYARPTGYKEDYVSEIQLPQNETDRKGFIRDLSAVLMDRLKQLEGNQGAGVLMMLKTALEEKRLLAYFHAPAASGPLNDLGWDGSVHPPKAGDYLLVTETNVAFTKANRLLQRSVEYTLSLGEGYVPEEAAVTISYVNANTAPARHCAAEVIDYYTSDDSCYKSYVRIYVPKGSQPLGAQGLDSTLEWYQEGDATVLAGLVVLPPGAKKEVTFRYVPPRSVVSLGSRPVYSLTLSKQPGIASLTTNFHLQCVADAGTTCDKQFATPLTYDLHYSTSLP